MFSIESEFSTASSQNSSASLMPNLYQTCQAQVRLWEQIEVRYAKIEKFDLLGKGAYAEVFRGSVNGIECAIKTYRLTATAAHRHESMREIQITASLDHPCTLRILGWTRNPLQTMTELCCGDLKAYYSNKIEQFQYSEMETLRLLRVRQSIAIFA